MTSEGFYWATIPAPLFSMLFARKDGVATIVSIAWIGYASGLFRFIYATIYITFDNDYIIDVLFRSVLLGLIYLIWIVFFTISEIVSEDKNLILHFNGLGITFPSFIYAEILALLDIPLYYNATSIVRSLTISIILFAFAVSSSSSKEKNADDFLIFALICSIMVFGIMYWINNLLDNYNIVIASGWHLHKYTYEVFVPVSLFIMPIFLAIRFIGYYLIKPEDKNDEVRYLFN